MERLSDNEWSRLTDAIDPLIQQLQQYGWHAEVGLDGHLYVFQVREEERAKLLSVVGSDIVRIEVEGKLRELPIECYWDVRPIGGRSELRNLLKPIDVEPLK
jgi:hypothetical protein